MGEIDFAGFVRLMTSQAVTELSSTEGQLSLQRAFQAIDMDGSGEISMDEMMKAIQSVCSALPADNMQAVCAQPSPLAREAITVFDMDEKGAINYEEFVSMVSGRDTVY